VRRLGILGGMAWPSTAEAYRLINTEVRRRLGGVHSAELIVWSVDFAEHQRLQRAGAWDEAGGHLADAAARLEAAGAEGLLLCTNTMHRVADAITDAVDIPLIHIADATATAIRSDGHTRVGLLGTRYTMELDFYRGRLEDHGLDVLVPSESDRGTVHDVIYGELVHGDVRDDSRDRFRAIAADLVAQGAEGIIAGCTEIELLLGPDDVAAGFYPTTSIHTLAAVDWMLADA
jgi:aspartate racemase